MTTLREAAQMALDALDSDNPDIQLRAATALRAALAQPEQGYETPIHKDIGGGREAKTAKKKPEQEPVGNTITFMTRAIFNVVANHQEINGGYFIADGDVAAFVDRLAKVINSTFEPLKPKNTAPPQREWQDLKIDDLEREWLRQAEKRPTLSLRDFMVSARAAANLLREKNS